MSFIWRLSLFGSWDKPDPQLKVFSILPLIIRYDSLHTLTIILWWKRSNNKVYVYNKHNHIKNMAIVLEMKCLLVEKVMNGCLLC